MEFVSTTAAALFGDGSAPSGAAPVRKALMKNLWFQGSGETLVVNVPVCTHSAERHALHVRRSQFVTLNQGLVRSR